MEKMVAEPLSWWWAALPAHLGARPAQGGARGLADQRAAPLRPGGGRARV